MSQTNTQKIIDEFSKLIDCEKTYTKSEFNDILTQAFKNNKTNKTKNTNGVKKSPTKYNIFIKENMGSLKKENPELNRQELMKLASTKWNIHKINDNKQKENGDIIEDKKEEKTNENNKEENKDDENNKEENKDDVNNKKENKDDENNKEDKDNILEDKKVKKIPKKKVVSKKID